MIYTQPGEQTTDSNTSKPQKTPSYQVTQVQTESQEMRKEKDRSVLDRLHGWHNRNGWMLTLFLTVYAVLDLGITGWRSLK